MSDAIQLTVNGTVVFSQAASTPAPAPTPTPTPTPTPVTSPAPGDSFLNFTTVDDFVSTVQARLDKGVVSVLSPDMKLLADKPIAFDIKEGGGNLFGILGNGAQIAWNGGFNGGVDLLTFNAKVASECLIVEKLSLYGGGYEGRQCRNGLVFAGPKGIAIYRATVRDIVADYFGENGLAFDGDFFESVVDNASCSANYGNGCYVADLPATLNGVISNLMFRSPNLSRNRGSGLYLDDNANSVDVAQGSFINNGRGGIYANSGIRHVRDINGENTGLSLITIRASSYPSQIRDCNLSSDGATKEPTNGKPSQYVINFMDPSMRNLDQSGNYFTFYGGGTNTMALFAPAGTPAA